MATAKKTAAAPTTGTSVLPGEPAAATVATLPGAEPGAPFAATPAGAPAPAPDGTEAAVSPTTAPVPAAAATAAPTPQDTAQVGRQPYTVVSPLEHDGTRHDIGSTVWLVPAQAAPLLAHTVAPASPA